MVSRVRLAIIILAGVVCGVGGCIDQETPISVLPMTTGRPSGAILTPSSTPLIQGITPVGTLPAEVGTSSGIGSDPAPYVQKATEELAKALSISTSSITIVGNPLPVQWNDSSLGCPQQGQTYVPAVTPGYLFTLQTGGSTYEVHTDLNGVVVFCSNPNEDLGTITAPDPIAAEFISGAKKDLASRLNISVDSVVLVRSEAVEWPDGGLGCPKPGEEYEQGATPGYRIVLAVEETYYEYHTDYQRMVLCPLPTPTP
jgi:hypothetical protein